MEIHPALQRYLWLSLSIILITSLLTCSVLSPGAKPVATTTLVPDPPPATAITLTLTPTPASSAGWTSYTKILNAVTDLAFDHQGNLWAVAHRGVAKIDLTAHTITLQLADYRVNAIAVAPDSAVWVGTLYNGTFRFDGERWTRNSPPWSQVDDIAVASDGVVWFGSPSHVSSYIGHSSLPGGVARFDGLSWTAYTTDTLPALQSISAIAVGPDGAIWAAGAGSVARFDGETWTAYPTDTLPDFYIPSIAITPDGTPWVATREGVAAFDDEGWITYTTADGLASNLVDAVAVAPDGSVWVGTSGGVSHFDGQRWMSYTAEDGLGCNDVRSITVGPDGTLWFGTFDAIARFDGAIWTTYNTNGPGGLTITVAAAAPDGSVWFGTQQGGVSHFDGQHWTSYTIADGLTDNWIDALAVAPDGSVWVGADAGISHFNDQQWDSTVVDSDLENVHVRSIGPSSDGTVWIATTGYSTTDDEYVGRVSHFAPQTGTWTTYVDGLVDFPTTIVTAADGSVWVGGHGGISRFAPSTGSGRDGETWTTYTIEHGLTSSSVLAMTLAPDGSVCLSTTDGALFSFDGHAWRRHAINYAGFALAVTPDGTVWASTLDGVAHFDGERRTTYTEEDGLVHYHVTAITLAGDGAVWFGTDEGISRYAPSGES